VELQDGAKDRCQQHIEALSDSIQRVEENKQAGTLRRQSDFSKRRGLG